MKKLFLGLMVLSSVNLSAIVINGREYVPADSVVYPDDAYPYEGPVSGAVGGAVEVADDAVVGAGNVAGGILSGFGI